MAKYGCTLWAYLPNTWGTDRSDVNFKRESIVAELKVLNGSIVIEEEFDKKGLKLYNLYLSQQACFTNE